jgi:hypothetical protein
VIVIHRAVDGNQVHVLTLPTPASWTRYDAKANDPEIAGA